MARIDNLNNFLTDVAQSIKDKKGTTEKIPAANFDTEIASINAGTSLPDNLIGIYTSVAELPIDPINEQKYALVMPTINMTEDYIPNVPANLIGDHIAVVINQAKPPEKRIRLAVFTDSNLYTDTVRAVLDTRYNQYTLVLNNTSFTEHQNTQYYDLKNGSWVNSGTWIGCLIDFFENGKPLTNRNMRKSNTIVYTDDNEHVFFEASNPLSYTNYKMYQFLNNNWEIALLDTHDTNAIPNVIANGKTAYARNEKITGSMPNNENQRIKPLENQEVTIPDGYSKNGIVEAVIPMDLQYNKDCNLIAEDILGGVK